MPTQAVASRAIALSQIEPNPDQPRKYIDPAELDALKASLNERGLVNPISVQEIGEGRYRLIAGERRFRAAKALGWGNKEEQNANSRIDHSEIAKKAVF